MSFVKRMGSSLFVNGRLRWLIGLILVMSLVFTGGLHLTRPQEQPSSVSTAPQDKILGIWINYMEFAQWIDGNTSREYQTHIDSVIRNIKECGFNTVYLQVRSHSDSFYPSDIFPWSLQVNGGKGVSYDPVALFVETAHQNEIAVHGWVNPYRISSGKLEDLDRSHPALSLEEGGVVETQQGVYYNPAVASVRNLVLSGIRELLNRYALDGIQYDDYFYPTTDSSFDQSQYTAYCNAAANPLSLTGWRQSQVNTLIAGTYQTVHQYEGVVFGVSPGASLERNREELYADVSAWVAGGYIDYLCPQLYFGFHYPKEQFSFDRLVEEWCDIAGETALYIGLASYKVGQTDGGSDEWVTSTDLLARQVTYTASMKKAEGISVYHYTSFFKTDPQSTAQRNNFIAVAKEFS